MLIGQFFSPIVSIISAVIIIGISAIIFSSRLQSFYSKIESRFLANLNAREISEAAKRADELMPWDSHLAYYTVKPESDAVGKTLIELSLREHFGVNVALIERGKIKLKIPGKDERLYPGDRIAVIGTDDQLKNFEEFIEATSYKETDANGQSVSLHPITINAHSPLLGKSIKASGIRENAFSLVVGVERNNERILNPDSSFTFEKDDIVWIVGDKKTVQSVIKGEPS